MSIELGKRIVKSREAKHIKQWELAVRSCISVGFLSDVENGKRNISADNLLAIAIVLDKSLDWLMTGKIFRDEEKVLDSGEVK